MRKDWNRKQNRALSSKAKAARSYLARICALLEKKTRTKFHATVDAWNGTYEGHLICDGRCDYNGHDYVLSENGAEEVGMVFWGGHYSRKKHKDALSRAWISLLDDCIGASKIPRFTLSIYLKESIGVEADLDCSSLEELDRKLKEEGI